MEYRIRSFRIDDEVWVAVQKHELSANKLLRIALGLEGSTVSVMTAIPGLHDITPSSDTDNAAQLDAVGPELASGRGKASTETWKRGR